MAIGDDKDFRMVGFGQILRFPSQDIIGGPGSIVGREFTTPFGGNLQQPGSLTTLSFYNGDTYNQNFNPTYNNTTNNAFNNITNLTENNYTTVEVVGVDQIVAGTGITVTPSGGTGTVTISSTAGAAGVDAIVAGTGVTITSTGPGGTGTVTIDAPGGAAGVSSIIAGAGITVTPAGGTGNVTIDASGVSSIIAGSGISISASGAGGTGNVTITNTSTNNGATTLIYGKITSAAKTSGRAHWTYTVTPYISGTAQASVSAYNLLEESNTSTSAYGYTVTSASGGINITGTSFNIFPVPNNTWVAMEYTNFSGSLNYWFSAPNYIKGTC